MSSRIMIDLTDVVHNFQSATELTPAIKRTSFQIEENTFTIIYGPSGSGKSTLLNILSGLQKPSHGSVMVEGRDIYGLSPDELAFFRANRLGIVYQTTHWVRSLNVVENVAIPLYFLGYKRSVAENIALMTLQRVNMAQYATKSPLVLSGGEQQRVAMARALASSPLFVIADEPTGNLDSQNGDQIIELLQNCKTEFRCTVIMVTHNLEYIPLADKLIAIENGIVQVMPSGDMLKTTNQMVDSMQKRINYLATLYKS